VPNAPLCAAVLSLGDTVRAAGASKVRFTDYLIGTAIGMAPGITTMSALGYQIWSIVTKPTLLSEAVGGHGVEAKSIIAPDGEYGQVVLSRWPLGAPQIHDITHAEREPRRAIEVEVAAPAGSFKLIATLGMGSRPSRPRRLWLWIPGSAYARGPGMTEGERARPGITERSHKLRAMSTFMISLVPA
jgi:hypothetical protein